MRGNESVIANAALRLGSGSINSVGSPLVPQPVDIPPPSRFVAEKRSSERSNLFRLSEERMDLIRHLFPKAAAGPGSTTRRF